MKDRKFFYFKNFVSLIGMVLSLTLVFIITALNLANSSFHYYYYIIMITCAIVFDIIYLIMGYYYIKKQTKQRILLAQIFYNTSNLLFLGLIAYCIISIENIDIQTDVLFIFTIFVFQRDYFHHQIFLCYKMTEIKINCKRAFLVSFLFETTLFVSAVVFSITNIVLSTNDLKISKLLIHIFILYAIFFRTLTFYEHGWQAKLNQKKYSIKKRINKFAKNFNYMHGDSVNKKIEFIQEENKESTKNKTEGPNLKPLSQQNCNAKCNSEVNLKKPKLFHSQENLFLDFIPDDLPSKLQKFQTEKVSFNHEGAEAKISALGSPKSQKPDSNIPSICKKKFNSSWGYEFEEIENDEPTNKLWQYLPELFQEGISIFRQESLVKCNSSFCQMIFNVLEETTSLKEFKNNWQTFFDQIYVSKTFGRSNTDRTNKLWNFKDEILDILQTTLSEKFSESKKKYNIYHNNYIYEVSVYSKFFKSKGSFTIIKITDISKEYNVLSKKASKKIKKLIGMSTSHELKTPLNFLICTMKLIKKDVPSDMYCQLKNSLKIIQIVLNSLFKVAFVDNPKNIECVPEDFSISKLIQNLILTTGMLFKNRGLQLIFNNQVQQADDIIYHDKLIIESILYQLLSNSLKFTKKGQVTLTITYNSSEENYEISFKDTGIGMTKEEQSNLSTFLSTEAIDITQISKHSTGANLGLTICKTLVSRIHLDFDQSNRIFFTSKYGFGSTFIVKISKKFAGLRQKSTCMSNIPSKENHNFVEPGNEIVENVIAERSENSREGSEYAANSQEESEFIDIGTDSKLPHFQSTLNYQTTYKFFGSIASQQNESTDGCICPYRVLVVDDEEFNLISFTQVFTKLVKDSLTKYEIIAGHDGLDGLNIFKSYFENKKCADSCCYPIKLVILDYNMPVLLGPTVASKIRNYLSLNNIENSEIKIYGWTAYVGTEYRDKYIKSGANGVLAKPIKLKELTNLILKSVQNEESQT